MPSPESNPPAPVGVLAGTRRLDMESSGISIVLGTYNRKPYLKNTIAQVRREISTLGVPAEILVVDGGSEDGTIAWLTRQKDIVSIVQHNRGSWRGEPVARRSWGYFMNLAFKCAQGKYVCMLSDDCLIVPGAIRSGLDEFEQGLRQGRKLGALAFHWRNWPTNRRYFVIRVKGQVYVNHGLYLRRALEAAGYINEDDYHFYCADTDLCFRIVQAGYAVEATARALIEHSQHIAVKVRRTNKGKGKERLRHDEAMLQRNWAEFFGGDAYRDVTVYDDSGSPEPDDTFARQGFGRAYRIEKLKRQMARPVNLLKAFLKREAGS